MRVFCNIHPQMSAYVVVRDNPFWAQARQDGGFSITGLPAGTWVVRAWHARAGETTSKVTIPATGTVSLPLTLDATRYKRAQHRNKYGKKYKKGRY